jgi:hypothetical protein
VAHFRESAIDFQVVFVVDKPYSRRGWGFRGGELTSSCQNFDEKSGLRSRRHWYFFINLTKKR